MACLSPLRPPGILQHIVAVWNAASKSFLHLAASAVVVFVVVMNVFILTCLSPILPNGMPQPITAAWHASVIYDRMACFNEVIPFLLLQIIVD